MTDETLPRHGRTLGQQWASGRSKTRWAVASCAAQPRCLSRGTACGPSLDTGSGEVFFMIDRHVRRNRTPAKDENSLCHDRAPSQRWAVGQRSNEGSLGRPYPFARRELCGAAALSEQEQRDTGGWHRPIFRVGIKGNAERRLS